MNIINFVKIDKFNYSNMDIIEAKFFKKLSLFWKLLVSKKINFFRILF